MADKANQIILELKAENKLLTAKLKETQSELEKLDGKTKKTGDSMGNVFGKLKGLIAGYLGKEALFHLVNLAGEIDSVESSFQNLAAGASAGADGLLEAMTRAAKGTVDDTDVMKSANSAILTLGEDVADKLPKLMEIAFASAKATGKSTQEVFDRLVAYAQTGSSRMLRQVGISASQVDLYMKQYAKSMGLTVNQLTDAEKKQAALNAVMQAGQGVIQRMGGEGLSFGQKLQKLRAQMNDVGDTFARTLTPAMENLIDIWFRLTESQKDGESFFKASTWAKSFGVVINSMVMKAEEFVIAIKGAIMWFKELGTAFSTWKETGSISAFWEQLKKGTKEAQVETSKMYADLEKKYTDLNEKTMAGGKRKEQQRQAFHDKEMEDEDAKYQRQQQNLQEKIKAYEDMLMFEEAEVLQKQMTYQQLLFLKEKYNLDAYAVDKAWEAKKVLLTQQSNNKQKQSDYDLLKAKMGFDRMEYQNAKEVFAQSSTLMQSKNKFIFNLGKGLAYASAVMSAAEGVAKVWSVWAAYPPVAAALSAVTLLATGVQIAKIKETKLPSYQKGRVPSFKDGYYPSNHFPAMIGADEAVINGRSTAANATMLKYMNDNPGQRVGGNVNVSQVNNFNGNVMNEEFVNSHVIPNLEKQARYQGKQLFAERR